MNMLKKSITILVLSIVFLLCMVITSNAATTGTITQETVRLRKKASTDSDILTLISVNSKVEIIEESGDWYKVSYNGYTGYVYAEYVKTSTDNTNKSNTDNTNNTNNTNTKTENSKMNVYILPLINSNIIGTIKASDATVVQVLNGWAYISTDSIYGWVRNDKLEENLNSTDNTTDTGNTDDNDSTDDSSNTDNSSSETKTGYVNYNGVNFRKEPKTSSTALDVLYINTKVTILEEVDSAWYKIEVDGVTGYIAKDFISDSKVDTTNNTTSRSADISRTSSGTSSEEESSKSTDTTPASSDSDLQSQIVAYAKSFLGSKYVYGGSSPTTGFDCSGFTSYVYKHFGYTISRTSSAQASNGVAVSKSNLQPGDLVIFKAYNDYSRIGHVGIYIGDNKFIHASDESTGVIITSLSYGSYPTRFVTGRRII